MIAKEAGQRILAHDPRLVAVQYKSDNSPVTIADQEANDYISAQLSALTPQIPVVAEESAMPSGTMPETFWLVDPLDGTRSFTRGEPEYTVNIALIHKGRPVLGVIYLPPADKLYYGMPGKGAFRVEGDEPAVRLQVRTPPARGLAVIKSRSHPSPRTVDFLNAFNVDAVHLSGSSHKFCQIAEGKVDMYPRFGQTMEWDTAAGQAILEAAGGVVQTTDGQTLAYAKEGFVNPHFIASATPYRNLQKTGGRPAGRG